MGKEEKREAVKERAEDLGKAVRFAGIQATGRTSAPITLKTRGWDFSKKAKALGNLTRKEVRKEEAKAKEDGPTSPIITLGRIKDLEKAKADIHLGMDLLRWTLGMLTWEADSRHLPPHLPLNPLETNNNKLREVRSRIFPWERAYGAWDATT